MFSFLFLRLIPRIYPSVSPISPCFSTIIVLPFFLSFLLLLLPYTFQSFLRISFHLGSSYIPLLLYSTFSTTLSHVVPARLFVSFSHTALSTMACNLAFDMFLDLYCHFIILMPIFVQVGIFAVLLLVLYYSSCLSILL